MIMYIKKSHVNKKDAIVHSNPECGYLLRGSTAITSITVISVEETGLLEKWYIATTDNQKKVYVCSSCSKRNHATIVALRRQESK